MQIRQRETARVFDADLKKLARAIRELADAERNEDGALQAFRKHCPRFDELMDDRFAADERTKRAEKALEQATARFKQKMRQGEECGGPRVSCVTARLEWTAVLPATADCAGLADEPSSSSMRGVAAMSSHATGGLTRDRNANPMKETPIECRRTSKRSGLLVEIQI